MAIVFYHCADPGRIVGQRDPYDDSIRAYLAVSVVD